jgi:hypothetical protein
VARLPREAGGGVGDLRGWLQQHGAMPPAPALRLVAQLCAELGAAHKQGRVHGAVEPGNVLLVTGADGTLLGHLRDATTARGDDPAYAAPERLHDPAPSSRSDIYPLGCVLWACLTGAPPYAVSGHQEMRLAGGRPAPPELEALLEGMLRTEPADRFSSAAEIGREATWIADRLDPVPQPAAAPEAAPEAAPAPTSSSPWKNIGMVGVVGLALLAIAVGGYAVATVGDDPAQSAAEAAPAETPSTTPTPLATPPPAPVVEKKTFTCWTGRTVKSRKKCREPYGIRGVYWIFPLLDGQNCRPRNSDPAAGRRMLLECYFYGRQVRLDVSLWRDVSSGAANYTARLGQPADSGGKYTWDGRIGRRGYRHLTAYLWTSHAYSVAVYATRPVLGAAVRKSGYTSPVPDNRYYGSKND